jgi:hypothetical protein
MPDEIEVPKLSEWSGIIPHFHYDVMGRIVPGAYLLIGAFWLLALDGIVAPIKLSLSATSVVLLLVSAYALGFIMGPLSHFLFNWLCHFRETDIPAYARPAFAGDDFKGLTAQQKSELAFYTLWLCAPQLAIMCSRWDAEAFAARQFGTATLLLALRMGYMMIVGPPTDHPRLLLSVTMLMVAMCAYQFRYSRRKGILGRFIMFARASAEKATGAAA